MIQEPVTHEKRLADRLGTTWHASPLLNKLRGIAEIHPSGATTIEGWLIDVANARGAWVVSRVPRVFASAEPPSEEIVPNEDLVVALCLAELPDNLQRLRLAAQLISRGGLDLKRLGARVCQERVGLVLKSLALEALRVDAEHPTWRELFGLVDKRNPGSAPLLLHWSRLAFPIPDSRGVASGAWRLVA